MTLEQFRATLAHPAPPAGVPPVAAALWHDANGDWKAAHDIAQSGEGTPAFDRLHAYLHRKEGDAFNARYWYRRSGTPEFKGSLEQEWAELLALHLP